MTTSKSDPGDSWLDIIKIKQLIEHYNVLTCYPILLPYVRSLLNRTSTLDIKETASKLFPIKKLLESPSNGIERKRFFESTLRASIQKLSESKERFLVVTPELLPDGTGVTLISAAKKINHASMSLLILTHNHQVDFKTGSNLGADALISEESIENRSGALIASLEALARGNSYIDPALKPPCTQFSEAKLSKLSPRQIEVLQLVAEGYTNPDIAKQLQISTTTARDHVQSILQRLDVKSRAAAAVEGLRHGILK